MIAVISAGGRGTRLQSVYPDLPKPLVPVQGKAISERAVETLQRQGVTDFIFTLGYRAESIRRYFGDGSAFGVRIRYVTEQVPLGSVGALAFCKERLDSDFLFVSGDLVFDFSLSRFWAFHGKHGAVCTAFAHPSDHLQDSSRIRAEESGKVLCVYSKGDIPSEPCRNLTFAGIYLLSPRVLAPLCGQRADVDEIIAPWVNKGLYAYRSAEYVRDAGTPERLQSVQADLKAGLPRRKNADERQRAVFLDRDGTVNVWKGFIRRPDQIELLPGAAEAIAALHSAGYLVIVVTNQPVIARGEVTEETLYAIHAELERQLAERGAYVDDIFYCPHHPHGGYAGEVAELKVECPCRKPQPGLLLRAAERYNIDLESSWMAGDAETDVLAGKRAHCRTVRIRNGAEPTQAEFAGESLADCVNYILKH